MKGYAYIIIMVLLTFVAFSFALVLMGHLFTRKYNKKFRKLYSLFMGLSFREVFILSTTVLNMLIMFFFLLNVNYYYPIGFYMLIATNFLSCLFSFKFRIIVIDIIYTLISCAFLWLLMTIRNYYSYVGESTGILILVIIFIILIAVYTFFITVRKINYLINMHEKVEVNNG